MLLDYIVTGKQVKNLTRPSIEDVKRAFYLFRVQNSQVVNWQNAMRKEIENGR
jgi:hypothetical protein